MKVQSPLLGFNNNVKHKGRVFHIQTEDSGVKRPHIITHLFADGGRILKTTKTSYAEHVGNDDALAETVTAMMKEQHKAMFIALRDGQFDHLFDGSSSASGGGVSGSTAAVAARREVEKAATIPRMATPALPAATLGEPEASPLVIAAAREPLEPPATPPSPALLAPVARSNSPTAVTTTMASSSQPPEPSLDLDLDALERAAAEAQTPFFHRMEELPPPPASVLGKKSSAEKAPGSYRAVTPAPPSANTSGRSGATPAQGSSLQHRIQPPAPPPEATKPAPTAGRYAASRPAAIFANTRPSEGASIFGEELISEKSLDEVILSYLAEDLEDGTK